NFVTHLSGIATATRAWADAVAGTGCTLRDTRKTTPGLRQLEKYAVRCGGGGRDRGGDPGCPPRRSQPAARGRMRHPAAGRRGPGRGRRAHPARQHGARRPARRRHPGPRVPGSPPGGQRRPAAGHRAGGGGNWRRLHRRRRPHSLKPGARPWARRAGLLSASAGRVSREWGPSRRTCRCSSFGQHYHCRWIWAVCNVSDVLRLGATSKMNESYIPALAQRESAEINYAAICNDFEYSQQSRRLANTAPLTLAAWDRWLPAGLRRQTSGAVTKCQRAPPSAMAPGRTLQPGGLQPTLPRTTPEAAERKL